MSHTAANLPKINTTFIALLFITVNFGVATPAIATPYTILIEDPTVWRITGSFDSASDMWNGPGAITNWEFLAEVFGTLSIAGRPLVSSTHVLSSFAGSTSQGVTDLQISGDHGLHFTLESLCTASTCTDGRDSLGFTLSPWQFNGSAQDITNKASAVPEPTTAILLVTGLAGYRWSQARRERTQVR